MTIDNAWDEKWSEWISYEGKICPVKEDAIVQVRLRGDSDAYRAQPQMAIYWSWRNTGFDGDIIAYRYKIKEPASDVGNAMHPDLQWLADNVSEWGGSEKYPFIGLWRDPDRPVYSAFRGTREVWTRAQWKTARRLRGLDQPEVTPVNKCLDNAWDEPTPEEEEAWQAKEKQDVIPEWWKGHKQARYLDRNGRDWIDEFAETATIDEFRGAMRFTIGKYNRRAGKKDELVKEIDKMRDYCERWLAYEARL